MEDIELARSLLEEEKGNLVVVKEGQVPFSSRERRLAPFFQAVQSVGKSLHNATMASRIVGQAAAMLCLQAQITLVYAGVASQGALDMLKGQGLTVTSKSTVPYIYNCDRTDLYPFEELAGGCQGPSQLFAALQSLFAEGAQ